MALVAVAAAAFLAAGTSFEERPATGGPVIGTAPLHDALLALPFSNYDEVSKRFHNFSMRPVSSIYLEAEAPLKARWAWADGRITPFHTHSYLFVENATANQTTGGAGQGVPGWGVPPAGMRYCNCTTLYYICFFSPKKDDADAGSILCLPSYRLPLSVLRTLF